MATAAVMTYTSLVENIESYLERTDTATLIKIPLFIMLAEQIIASQIKFLGNLTVNTSAIEVYDIEAGVRYEVAGGIATNRFVKWE